MTMTTRMLVEDFLQGGFPRGTQLINGEVVMNDPTLLHQRAVSRIHLALGIWTTADPQRGEAGLGGNWRFGPATSLIPDVWWVPADISAQLEGLLHDEPPGIAVEVRSPSTWHYDTGVKLRYYESAGVQEVWLVDTAACSVIVHHRSTPACPVFDESYEIAEGELTSPLLDGFAMAVPPLFAGSASTS